MSDQFQQKRVLITGGTGFIGSHLTKDLCVQGARVTVLDRSSAFIIPMDYVVMDQIQSSLAEALAQRKVDTSAFDFIFHLAGNSSVPSSLEDPFEDLNANGRETLALVENMRQSKSHARLVFMSSIAVYGSPLKMPIVEGDPVQPVSPYGISKLAAENYISVYCRLYNLAAAILRVGSAYGPGQRKMAVYELMARLKQDRSRLIVEGDGSQARDFIHVSDVVAALKLAALHADQQASVYNVASGQSLNIRGLIDHICTIAGLHPEIIFTNTDPLGKPSRWEISVEKIRALGFVPRISLTEGLKENWDWLA